MAKILLWVLMPVLLASTAIADGVGIKLAICDQRGRCSEGGVVTLGGSVQITCHVPKNKDNRHILYGITDVSMNELDIEGEAARVTWVMPKIKVHDCFGTTAYCASADSMYRGEVAKKTFTISGCDDGQ